MAANHEDRKKADPRCEAERQRQSWPPDLLLGLLQLTGQPLEDVTQLTELLLAFVKTLTVLGPSDLRWVTGTSFLHAVVAGKQQML